MKIDYYETLKQMIDKARFESDTLDNDILYVPDLFLTLSNLLDEEVLTQEDRILINCAVGYLAVCGDVVPEDVYGVKGLFDDLFVITLILKKMYAKYPDIVKKNWTNTENDESLEEVLDVCYDKSSKILDEENLLDKVLQFSGLEPI